MIGLILYLSIINFYGFVIMAVDKRSAKHGKWRVPEKRLFVTAAAGGALGVWFGMYRLRHKTKHAAFVLGIPLILALHIAVLVCWFKFKGLGPQ